MTTNSVKPKPILKSVSCRKSHPSLVDKLIRQTWYFSRNFEQQTHNINDKLVYNRREWKVLRVTRTLHGYAYQLKFVRQLSETELQSVVFNIKEKLNEF